MQKEEWNDIYYFFNYDYFWFKFFVNCENMQDLEEKGYEIEVVGNMGGVDCFWVEFKNGCQNKQVDCQYVYFILVVILVFFFFFQKFLLKGNFCEFFVFFYL